MDFLVEFDQSLIVRFKSLNDILHAVEDAGLAGFDLFVQARDLGGLFQIGDEEFAFLFFELAAFREFRFKRLGAA